MKIDVGADIEAKCGKCGVSWHIIIALVDGEIAKVQCKQCDAYHKFRSPEGKPKKTSKKSTSSKSSSSSKKSRQPYVEPLKVDANDEKPPRAYSPKEWFDIGDRITHVKFGLGVVESSPGAGKIEVFFGDGRRTLAQARTAPKLEHGRIID